MLHATLTSFYLLALGTLRECAHEEANMLHATLTSFYLLALGTILTHSFIL